MKKYDDYKSDKTDRDLTFEEIAKINWTKYKIIVPTEEDRKELMDAFEHIHWSNIDTDFVTVNQLAHEYYEDDNKPVNNIIIDSQLFNKLNKK